MKRIAIIGPGKATGTHEGFAIGHAHGLGVRGLAKPVQLMAVDINAENLKAFGDRFEVSGDDLFLSTDALYNRVIPDVVAICTWPALHVPMAMEAMEKGVKGIVIEKPLSLDMEEIRALRAKAQETGTCITVAHQRRYAGHFQRMKEILDAGELGSPVQVLGHVGDGWDILSWTVHWFDMANFWFDGPPAFVLAGMDVTDTRRYHHAVENASTIYASYGERGSAQFVTGPAQGADIRMVGPKGMVASSDAGGLGVWTESGYRHETPSDDFIPMFVDLYHETLAAMDGGPEPRCSLNRCAAATEMAFAAQESARTARAVHLPLQTGFAPLEVMQHPITSPLRGKTVVLFADTHCDVFGRDGIAEAMKALTGQEVRRVDAEKRGLTAEDLEGADLLLLYHFVEHGDASFGVLQDWVESGKPTLVMHGALGAYKDRDLFKQWCGRIWDWNRSRHPHEACELTATKDSPVDFTWATGWLPKDEIYVDLTDVTPVIECLTANTPSGSYPAAWLSTVHANVGCWMPGHRPDCFHVPAMRRGIERMLVHLLA